MTDQHTHTKIIKVAFGCQSRVGKDTAADYIRSKLECKVIALSKPLYDIMYSVQSQLGLPYEKDTKFLQIVGTDWGRAKSPDLWINIALKTIRQHTNENILITDLRFKNEYEALKNEGFTVVRIIRDNRTIDRDPNHISENQLTNQEVNWDFVLENNTTMVDLHSKLDELLITLQN